MTSARRTTTSVLRSPTPGGVLRAALLLLVTVLFVFPAVMLVIGAFRSAAPGEAGSWTLEGFRTAFSASSTYSALKNSIILMVAATTISLGLGGLFAWISARTRTPLRALLTPVMILSLILPPLYYGFGWVLLANKETGALNKLFQDVLGIGLTVNVESLGGMVLVAGLGLTPFAYLLLIGPFRNLDHSLDEASRLAGAGQRQTLMRVVVPSLGPAIFGAGALIMVIVLQAFEVPQLLGRPAGVRVFSTEIYHYLYDFTPARYAGADALSLLIVVIVVGIFMAQRRLLAGRSFVTMSGKGFRPQPVVLGPVRFAFAALIALFAFVNLVMPVGAVLLASFQPIFGVYSNYTLTNYRLVFDDEDLLASLRLTAEVSVIGGAMAMAIALAIAYTAARRRGLFQSYVRFATWIPWGLPGIVLALSYLWASLATPGFKELYGTLWIYLLALLAVSVPLASRIADAALGQISEDLSEAARLAGASASRALVGIVCRLLLPSFLGGWFLCALFISGNLAIPVVLSSSSAQPVSVTAYTLFLSGQAPVAAALFCFVLAAVLAVVLVVGIVRLARRSSSSSGLVSVVTRTEETP